MHQRRSFFPPPSTSSEFRVFVIPVCPFLDDAAKDRNRLKLPNPSSPWVSSGQGRRRKKNMLVHGWFKG
jgi:hypothetical protein